MSDTFAHEDDYRERISPSIQELWILLGKPDVRDEGIIDHAIDAIKTLRFLLIKGVSMNPAIVDEIIREAAGNNLSD